MADLYEGMIVQVKKYEVIDHPGIVTSENGKWHVIHASPKSGVVIEPFEKFADGKTVYVSDKYEMKYPVWAVVQRARSRIGETWALWRNCQHFVSEICSGNPSSYQWQQTIGLVFIIVLIGITSKR